MTVATSIPESEVKEVEEKQKSPKQKNAKEIERICRLVNTQFLNSVISQVSYLQIPQE